MPRFHVSNKAAEMLDTLTKGLEIGEAYKIDNSKGSFMAVHVDRLSETVYSVAHYYSQNGDRCCDPDMTFHRTDSGQWIPVTYQDSFGYQVAVYFEDGKISKFAPGRVRANRTFAATWMENIRNQQNGAMCIRRAIRKIIAEKAAPVVVEENSVEAYWAGSISASVEADYKSGNVVVLDTTKEKAEEAPQVEETGVELDEDEKSLDDWLTVALAGI